MTLESLNYLSAEYYRRALAGELGGLTEEQALLFDYFKYDPDEGGRLVASVDIEIPLATLHWSDQWSASSGGASLFFQSTDQGIDFTPIMSGVKTQAIPENQDASGLVHPFYRKPSDLLTALQARGAMSTNPLDVAPYSGSTVSPADVEVVGVRAVLGEELFTGDVLTYTLYSGTDDTGPKVFTQRIEVTADRVPGFDFIGWFSRPSVAFEGDVVFAEIVVTPLDGGTERTLMVRSAESDPNVHWNEVQFRSFVDVPIVTEDYLTPVIVSATGTIEAPQQHAVDTTGGAITLTADEALTSFRVFDSESSFNTNNCTVVIGLDNYVLDKKDKEYFFYTNGTTWKWGESDLEVK